MFKKLTLFNHKGGVGKTTLTVNLACALADQGFRVLLADTDPQCNLTAFFLDEDTVDKLLDASDGPSGKTLWSAMKPVVEGTGDFRAIKPIPLAYNDRLFLLPGDIRLSYYESALDGFWRDCIIRGRRGFIGMSALSDLLDEIAIKHKIDFILHDTGPNVGALNRAILLDCDGFIVPVACDLFSRRALKTLGYSLMDWIKSWEAISEQAPEDVTLLAGTPTFLGYVVQGFRVYREVMTADAGNELNKIEAELVSSIYRPFDRFAENMVPSTAARMKLGEVQFFGALASKAQSRGMPLWEVPDAPSEVRARAQRTFETMASRLVKESRHL